MRVRGLSLLMVAVMAAAFNARAATPVVDAVAVQTTQLGTLVVDSGSKTFIYIPRFQAPVKGKVKCLVVETYKVKMNLPPLPPRQAIEKQVWGRASAGGKSYYFSFFSLSPGSNKTVHAIVRMGVSLTSSAPSLNCGAVGIGEFGANGVAIYR